MTWVNPFAGREGTISERPAITIFSREREEAGVSPAPVAAVGLVAETVESVPAITAGADSAADALSDEISPQTADAGSGFVDAIAADLGSSVGEVGAVIARDWLNGFVQDIAKRGGVSSGRETARNEHGLEFRQFNLSISAEGIANDFANQAIAKGASPADVLQSIARFLEIERKGGFAKYASGSADQAPEPQAEVEMTPEAIDAAIMDLRQLSQNPRGEYWRGPLAAENQELHRSLLRLRGGA